MTSLEDTLPPGLVRDAAKYVVRTGDASGVGLTRRFHIGSRKARRLLQVLENMGVVGPREESKVRDILVERRQLAEVLASLPGGEPS